MVGRIAMTTSLIVRKTKVVRLENYQRKLVATGGLEPPTSAL